MGDNTVILAEQLKKYLSLDRCVLMESDLWCAEGIATGTTGLYTIKEDAEASYMEEGNAIIVASKYNIIAKLGTAETIADSDPEVFKANFKFVSIFHVNPEYRNVKEDFAELNEILRVLIKPILATKLSYYLKDTIASDVKLPVV